MMESSSSDSSKVDHSEHSKDSAEAYTIASSVIPSMKAIKVDACGISCPGPIMKLKKSMEELASALDPISTSKVEELALELKDRYTIVIVTHNMQQAARISDKTAFFLLGELVEMGDTERLFSTPVDKRTEDYISGRFG